MGTYLLWGFVAVLLVMLLSDRFFEKLKVIVNGPELVIWDGPPTPEQQDALEQVADLILTHKLGLMMIEHELSAEAERRGVKMEGEEL